MKPWVTGASGFVGRALVRALIARGDEPTLLVRPSSIDRLDPMPASVRVVPITLPAGEAVLGELPPPDAVFHLAGIVARGRDVSLAEYEAVHLDATRELADQARRHGARFVHLSSISVIGCRDRAFVVDESTPCAPTNRYGITKLAGERAIAAAGAEHVILRAPGIWGVGSPGDPVLRIARHVARQVPFLPDEPPLSVVHVDNLVAAMLGVGLDARAQGVFYVDDGRPFDERELAALLACTIGRVPVLGRRGPIRRLARQVRLRGLELLRPLARAYPRFARALPPQLVFPTLDTRRLASAGHRSVITLEDACEAVVLWARAHDRL
jgi:nucleoside-diphosphate-sugar epimerase